MTLTRQELASRIDHTALKPETTSQAVEKLCAEALQWRCASVCVAPHWVPMAAQQLAKSDVAIGTVVGFPLGANRTAVKVFEAQQAVADGATELDMVINIGALKSGDWQTVAKDVLEVVKAAHTMDATVKVILECALLTSTERQNAARLAVEAGADYVKTSTGFGPGGATVADVQALVEAVGGACRVKAAGGIRSLPAALQMIEAGADRIGTSAGAAILEAVPQD